ncbi:uncharacterized protein [Henckelia pumila]|uniref:uncharacterized protein n=1 Tax=Henckelia pumila TaxID=405737 RepID=UPI003C6E1762
MEDSKQQRLDRFTPLSSPGFGNGRGNWVEHSNYYDAKNLCVIPAMCNDRSSMFFLPEYVSDNQAAYKQFTLLTNPQYRRTNGGQLFSPHQTPGSGSQENFIDGKYFGPGPFGRGNRSRNSVRDRYKFTREYGPKEALPSCPCSLGTSRFISPSSSGSAYAQPIDMRSNEQNVAKGFGLTANSSPWHQANQRKVVSSFNRNQFAQDKGGRRNRDMNSVSVSADALGCSGKWNCKSMAWKPKGRSLLDKDSLSEIKDVKSPSAICDDMFNLEDFKTDYKHAKFFVIKSFNEDNIHKSIKYGVWASTKLGNRKLDAAYRDAKEMEGSCPLFLFFSVNGSGQFYGVAEMVGPLDFENDADYWNWGSWGGQFPVKWHIVKDVPSSLFHSICLENNDNNYVTQSRDSQEVDLEQGIKMIKIFKKYDAETSILDDFNFFEGREKVMQERKDKQRSSSTAKTSAYPATKQINQRSDYLADTLNRRLVLQ